MTRCSSISQSKFGTYNPLHSTTSVCDMIYIYYDSALKVYCKLTTHFVSDWHFKTTLVKTYTVNELNKTKILIRSNFILLHISGFSFLFFLIHTQVDFLKCFPENWGKSNGEHKDVSTPFVCSGLSYIMVSDIYIKIKSYFIKFISFYLWTGIC